MGNASIPTRLPQADDSVAMLLGRGRIPYLTEVGLARASRTTSTSTATIDARGFRGIIIQISMWSSGGAGGVLPTILGVDPNFTFYPQLAVLDTGYVQGNNFGWIYEWGPGYATSSAGLGGGRLPPFFRINVAHSSANAYDYAMNYTLLD